MSDKWVVFLEPKGSILDVVKAAHRKGFKTLCMASGSLSALPQPYHDISSYVTREVVCPPDFWIEAEEAISCIKEICPLNMIAGTYSGVESSLMINAFLRAKVGLPFPTPQVAGTLLNKLKVRQVLREAGLSDLKVYSDQDMAAAGSWPFSGSAYFKPVRGSGSLYVARVSGFDDLEAAKKDFLDRQKLDSTIPGYMSEYIRSDYRFFCEEEFAGELMSLEAITCDGRLNAIGLLSRIMFSQNNVVELGSCFPYRHVHEKKIRDVVAQAHKALNIDHLPTHTELIVSPSGEVEIIDLNPRFVGADVLQSVNSVFETKFEDQLLSLALGEPVKTSWEVKNHACLQYLLPPAGLEKFESIQFPQDESIRFTRSFKNCGDLVNSDSLQTDVVGCFLTVDKDPEHAVSLSRKFRDQVVINSSLSGRY